MKKLLIALGVLAGLWLNPITPPYAIIGVSQLRAQLGTPQEVTFLNLTGQLAAISTTPLDSVRTNAAGLYRITSAVILTTAGTAGTIGFTFTCNNGVATQTFTGATVTTTASLGTEADNVFQCFAAASTQINYTVAFTSVTGTPAYAARARVEWLN